MKINYNLILKKTGNLFFIGAVIAVLSILITCSGDDEDPPLEGDKYSINDIAGNWTATEATFSSAEVPNKGSLDVIGEGGTLTLSIQTNGRFKITIALPDKANQIFTGQLGFDEEWLAVSYDDDPGEYEYWFIDLNDNKTILTLRGEGTYDFEDDGMEDPSYMDFVLSRN